MPVHPDSHLETVSLVLTKDQARRLRALRDAQRTPLRRVSISDVARSVVEHGLESYSRDRIIGIDTSDNLPEQRVEEPAA